MLHYKGMTKVLNDFVVDLIDKGKLKNKKFEISAGGKDFGGTPSIEVSQNESSYFVIIHGEFTLKRMVRIIYYFASPDWNSFCTDRKEISAEYNKQLSKTFDRILDAHVKDTDMSFFVDKEVEVLTIDSLKIKYAADSLFYELNGLRLKERPDNPIPIKLKNRFFITNNDIIVVYENGKPISSSKIPHCLDCVHSLYWQPGSEWLNLLNDGKYLLSYSYKKNKFFNVYKDSN
jgi:hypothetical protein